MTRFAKYVSEDYVKFPPKNLKTPTLIAFGFDKNESLLKEQGYLELVYMEEPTAEEGFYSVPHYQLVDVPETATYIAVTFSKEPVEATEEE